jgi:hypothetical protein
MLSLREGRYENPVCVDVDDDGVEAVVVCDKLETSFVNHEMSSSWMR